MVSARVEGAANLLDRRQELRQAFKGEEFTLERNDDRVGGGERIDGEKIERGRTINQDIGDSFRVGRVRGAISAERIPQLVGAVGMAGDFELDPQKIHSRGRDDEARHRGRNDDVAQRLLADQHFVARSCSSVSVDAEPGRRVALGIEIEDQHPLADRGERGAEVDGGGGLADAALLVRHGENARTRGAVGLANEGLGLGLGHGL